MRKEIEALGGWAAGQLGSWAAGQLGILAAGHLGSWAAGSELHYLLAFSGKIQDCIFGSSPTSKLEPIYNIFFTQ